jgi:xylulokinase
MSFLPQDLKNRRCVDMDACVLSVDLGTTNCKVLLIDENGNVKDRAVTEYSFAIPHTGWAEQNPEDWWSAVRGLIQRITSRTDPKAIKAIGLSGQMHGLVILDTRGEVIRPSILWNDQRSGPQCQHIYERVGGVEGLLELTNNAMLPGYVGGKLLWIRQHEPDIYARIATVLLPKDYIRYRLTGEYGTDFSDASGTGLFDVKHRSWSHKLLDLLEFPPGFFPPVRGSTEITGSIQKTIAEELGFSGRIPVINGGGDAAMQPVGSAVVKEDCALIVLGTGSNFTVNLPKYSTNPAGKLQVFCSVLPGRWIALGVTVTAGSSLKWYRDTFAGSEIDVSRGLGIDAYELLNNEAQRSIPGAGGLVFLPYLLGERCPHPDPHLRAVLFGLGYDTKRSDVIRSIMEGVSFSLREVLELIMETGISPSYLIVSGGGARSPLWMQILSDVLKLEVRTLSHSEDGSALGAGIVAGLAIGFWKTPEEVTSRIHITSRTAPRPENSEIYKKLFELYRGLYRALRPRFEERRRIIEEGEKS